MIPIEKTVSFVVGLLILVLLACSPWFLFRNQKGLFKPWLAGSMVLIVRELILYQPFMRLLSTHNPNLGTWFVSSFSGTFVSSLFLVLSHLLIRLVILKGVLRRPQDQHRSQDLITMGIGQGAISGILGVGVLFVQNILIIRMINNESIYDLGLETTYIEAVIKQLQGLSVFSILSSIISLGLMMVIFSASTWILGKGLRRKGWKMLFISVLLELLYYVSIQWTSLLTTQEWIIFLVQLVVVCFVFMYIKSIYRRENHERF